MYPPPHMEDLSAQLAGKKVLSKLDLWKGYYQVPVAAKDVPKTAVITPFSLFEFLRMPFGQGWALRSFPFGTLRSFPFKKENVTFFSILFSSFWRLIKPKRTFHSFLFFSKERKRTLRSLF